MKRFERLYWVEEDRWEDGWGVFQGSKGGNNSVRIATYESEDVAKRVAALLAFYGELEIATIKHRADEAAWQAGGGKLT